MTETRKSRLLFCGALAIPILAFTVSFFGASFGYRLLNRRPQTNAQAGEPVSHTLYGGFWRTDGSFVTTLRIENVLVARPLQVTPTLYMADGTPYALPPVEIPDAGVTTININQALAQAPRSVAAHLSNIGSASLTYTYASGGHVNASTLTLDVPHSLTFSYPFMEMLDPNAKPPRSKNKSVMSNMLQPSHHVMEGLWWQRDAGVTGFLTLSNATMHPAVATISMRQTGDDSAGEGRPVPLAPHATRFIPLAELGDRGGDSSSQGGGQQQAGGIRIEYDGMMGDISVSGDLVNEREGYSARMPLWDRDTSPAEPKELSYASAGLMIGQPDPMMMPGFPPQTRFTPYLALRNSTANPMVVRVGLNYMDMNGNPVSLQLPEESLRPFEAEQVDLTHELDAAGLAGFNGTINLAVVFTGKAGDVIVATGSVDQTGTYVFEVAPQAVSKTNRKIGSYWSAANGNDTMFSLWNPTGEAQDIAMTFYYGDGSGTYNLPVHLDAEGSAMVDVNMLKMEQTPDAQGKTFREDAGEGSLSFANAKPASWMTLIASGGTFNVQTATCGDTCIQCCGDDPTSFFVSPTTFNLAVGQNETFVLYGNDCQGSRVTPPVSSWSSDDTTVATVDDSGKATGVAPGTANINASTAVDQAPEQQVCDEYNPQCPPTDPPTSGQASAVTVTPSITSISPSMGPISGSVTVTIYGTGLAGATVSAGSQITVTVNSTSEKQIQATFAISNTAAGGNASVTAYVSSQPSNNVSFYVQIPTSLSIVSGTNSTSSEASCNSGTGCGMARTFTYQVNDQSGQAIQYANLQVWDAISPNSPNNLNLAGFTTTCTFANETNSGPCDRVTNSAGQFPETDLGVCAPACQSNNMCITAGETAATQTWHVGPSAISQNIGYYCDHVTVNGQ